MSSCCSSQQPPAGQRVLEQRRPPRSPTRWLRARSHARLASTSRSPGVAPVEVARAARAAGRPARASRGWPARRARRARPRAAARARGPRLDHVDRALERLDAHASACPEIVSAFASWRAAVAARPGCVDQRRPPRSGGRSPPARRAAAPRRRARPALRPRLRGGRLGEGAREQRRGGRRARRAAALRRRPGAAARRARVAGRLGAAAICAATRSSDAPLACSRRAARACARARVARADVGVDGLADDRVGELEPARPA